MECPEKFEERKMSDVFKVLVDYVGNMKDFGTSGVGSLDCLYRGPLGPCPIGAILKDEWIFPIPKGDKVFNLSSLPELDFGIWEGQFFYSFAGWENIWTEQVFDNLCEVQCTHDRWAHKYVRGARKIFDEGKKKKFYGECVEEMKKEIVEFVKKVA